MMKEIDLSIRSLTLPEILQLAGESNVILRTSEGRQFVLAEIDDFADEVAAVVKNRDLMKLLDDRSKPTATVPLSQARQRLEGKKNGRRKSAKTKRN